MKKLIIIILFFAPFFLIAQTSWMHYFSTLEINDAIEYQDKIWVATDNGVYTIDKVSQAIHHYDKYSSELTDNHIQTLSTDMVGNLWIGTYDVIVAKVPPGGDPWQTFTYPNMAINEYIVGSEVDNSGTLWIASNERLLSYNGIVWKHHAAITITNAYITDIELDGNHQLKILTDSLHTFDTNTSTLVSTVGLGSGFAYDAQDLYLENDSTAWILIAIPYLPFYTQVIKLENNQITTYEMFQDLPAAPLDGAALFAVHHTTGSLCYATDSSKLVVYNPMADTWEIDNQFQGVLPVPIKEMVNDDDGNLWFFNQDIAMQSDVLFPKTVSFADRKPFNNEAEIAADNNGIVYVSNKDDKHDVPLMKIENGIWDTIQIMGGLVTGITSVAFDGNNNMWAGAFINQTSIGILEQVNNGWVMHDQTSSNNVLPIFANFDDFDQIIVDQFGVVWVIYGENQIYKYENGTWSNPYNSIYPTNEFERIQVDHTGNLWWIEWDDVKKLNKNTNLVETITSSGMSNLHDLHIDKTTGELFLLGGFPNGEVKTFANGNWTSVVGFNEYVFSLDVFQGMIYAAYDELFVYDMANSSLSIYDTTKLEGITSLLVNHADGSVWMQEEHGRDIIVMKNSILNNNSNPVELLEEKVQIYPNPTGQFLHINSSLLENGDVNQIQIINSIGQVIQTIDPTTTINVDQLPTGVYWIQLQTKDENHNKSFIKN